MKRTKEERGISNPEQKFKTNRTKMEIQKRKKIYRDFFFFQKKGNIEEEEKLSNGKKQK